VAGVAAGPKDIPDAIVEGGAAAMEAAMYLERTGRNRRGSASPGEWTGPLPATTCERG